MSSLIKPDGTSLAPVGQTERMVPGRADGRVEVYDIVKGARSICDQCFLDNAGDRKRQYPYGEVVIVSPDDSPYRDGIDHRFCIGHLMALIPNVVIADPNDAPAKGAMRVRDPRTGDSWVEGE